MSEVDITEQTLLWPWNIKFVPTLEDIPKLLELYRIHNPLLLYQVYGPSIQVLIEEVASPEELEIFKRDYVSNPSVLERLVPLNDDEQKKLPLTKVHELKNATSLHLVAQISEHIRKYKKAYLLVRPIGNSIQDWQAIVTRVEEIFAEIDELK